MVIPSALDSERRYGSVVAMNYRHAFHAGNFADVLKHAALALIIDHMRHKAAPFRVIDTHAGVGRYDLGSDEAQRTGEWRDGIRRVLAEPLPHDIAEIMGPYLAAVFELNGGALSADIRAYPGSPWLARMLLRPQDQLVVNELHPTDRELLEEAFAHDTLTKVLSLDGWMLLKSLLPPKERRGVILIDPPFEVAGEFGRLLQALKDGVRRFATGVYVVWYPIKATAPVGQFLDDAARLGLDKLLSVQLHIRAADETALSGCGLLILNPPHLVAERLGRLSSFLAERLAQGPGAHASVNWLEPMAGQRALD